MKAYEKPSVEYVALGNADVIATSSGWCVYQQQSSSGSSDTGLMNEATCFVDDE